MTDTPDTSPAQLHWDADGQPLSSAYSDVYFSRHDGLAETRHVFIAANQLPARFAALEPSASTAFTIAETGFGTGLNFLATWQLWRQQPRGNNRLHFISVEKHPLALTDLTRALALWPELAPLAGQMTAQYPEFVGRGIQRLHFSDNVSLTLIIDEAAAGFNSLLWPNLASADANIQPRVDAWFLDGFAPSKNPGMWSDDLFASIAALSGHHTTAATFSAAGVVKRGLLSAGFTVRKVPGFGRKREMVIASRTEPTTDNTAPFSGYYQHATHPPGPKTALVIGAGLAGCHSARALAESGWQVTVIEQDSPASGGSGNAQGLLYARLSHRRETLPLFNLHALMYAQRHYQPLWRDHPEAGKRCGLLQLADTEKQTAAQQQVVAALHYPDALVKAVSVAEATSLSGIALEQSGLYFANCGWLDPRYVCRWLLDHANIQLRCGETVARLTQQEGHWHALTAQNRTVASATIAVVACAERSAELTQLQPLPLKPIRGQISTLAATSASNKLATALCGHGYLAPANNGSHSLGATFNLGEYDLALTDEDHQRNLQHLRELGQSVTELFGDPGVGQIKDGRAAFRCTTPDYLPVVGPVPDYAALKHDFAELSRNAKAVINTQPSYHDGLYVNCGHGSRGLAYAPISAQLLCDIINREGAPLDADLAQALHPARFALRDLIRGR